MDGTYGRTQELSPDLDRVTGRIKLGTESNGGFRNIAISNCTFERSRGLALETVDGGVLEDVVVDNIVMREVTTAPIFLRLGQRGRGPGSAGPGALRRVTISNVTASGIDPRYAAIIAGAPGLPIEDVSLSNIELVFDGGPPLAPAGPLRPDIDEAYPEPSMFGVTPAFGLYVRHARGLRLENIHMATSGSERRPAVVLEDVSGLSAEAVISAVAGAPPMELDLKG
jgi:hypothetical protein